MSAKCKEIFHVNGVPGLAQARWMGCQLGLNLLAPKPMGIWGGPPGGAQPAGADGGIEVPTSPQGSQFQAGVQAGDRGRGRLGQGCLRQLGALPGTADVLGPAGQQCLGCARTIGALSHCRQLPGPSQGKLCQAGARRYAGARAGTAAAASGQPFLAKNTLTFPVSPRGQVPTCPACCSRHHQGAWHQHPVQDQPPKEQRGPGCRGQPLACGGSWQCPPHTHWAMKLPAVSPFPVTPVHLVFLMLGGAEVLQ